jgi:oligopeptide transport system ATP-binding protein
MTPRLAVKDLCTYFKTEGGLTRAVDGVSFELAPGETLGLVGESGSGKSVTALSLLRLVQSPGYYARGEIVLEGKDLLKLPERDMRALRGDRLAMIFQDPMTSLNPFLTVGTQLCEVLELHKRLRRKAARARVIDMLGRVGIADGETRIDQYPHELSGGMRQRVMIAMALLCEPALLIADEPTTALDVTIQAQILDLLRELKRSFDTSIILITHDLGVVAGMADRVAVMYAGRIVETASAQDLFAHPAHPYTQGLLRSVPRLDEERRAALTSIPGLPPDLAALPPGCPFQPRCSRPSPRCREAYPDREQVGEAHWAACWHLDTAARKAAP